MKTKMFNTTVLFYPNKNPKLRLFALWYFTTLMIVWNVVGHTVLGFEQSWATPLTAIATAIAVIALVTGAAQAQLRSPNLSDANEKARKEFEKRNEKARQAIVIPTKPSRLPASYGPTAARDALEKACEDAAK